MRKVIIYIILFDVAVFLSYVYLYIANFFYYMVPEVMFLCLCVFIYIVLIFPIILLILKKIKEILTEKI